MLGSTGAGEQRGENLVKGDSLDSFSGTVYGSVVFAGLQLESIGNLAIIGSTTYGNSQVANDLTTNSLITSIVAGVSLLKARLKASCLGTSWL